MNRDDITRMARVAGFEIDCCSLEWHDRIERFAALVAAAEREACAALCEQMDHDGVMIAADCAAAIRARSKT